MNEALIVGALLLVLIGAVAFYLYSRVLFTERKLGLIESLLLDIRMNMEMEDPHMRHVAVPTAAAPSNPVQHESTANTIISDEIEADVDAETADVYKSVMEEAATAAPVAPAAASAVDYDLLSREEVALLAEKRGIRVTKRMAKGTIIALLQEGDKAQPQQGNSDVSGVPVASSSGGAPLDSIPLEEVE